MNVLQTNTEFWLMSGLENSLKLDPNRLLKISGHDLYSDGSLAYLMRELNRDLTICSNEGGEQSLGDILKETAATILPKSNYKVIELGVSDDHKNVIFVSPNLIQYIGVDISPNAFQYLERRLSIDSHIDYKWIISSFEELAEPSQVRNDRYYQSIFLLLGWTFGNYTSESIINILNNIVKPGDVCVIETAISNGTNSKKLLEFYDHELMNKFFDCIVNDFNLYGKLQHVWLQNGTKQAVVSLITQNNNSHNKNTSVILNVARKPKAEQLIGEFNASNYTTISHLTTGDGSIGVFAFEKVKS